MEHKLTCLVVDDDPDVRKLVALHLTYEGLDVHLADSGYGVEELVKSHQPDVVLLDVMMPGRDGYAVLGGLKACESTRHIPVVLLSAKAADDDIWDGWKAGADYYLTKPFRVEELVSYLRFVVARHRCARSGARRR